MKAIIVGVASGAYHRADVAGARHRLRAVRTVGHHSRTRRRINTLPHAIRELAGLGLLDRLDAAAIRTTICTISTATARRSGASARSGCGHDVPQFSIHRGRLQGVIHRAVEERLAGRPSTPAAARRFAQHEGGVIAHFFDRTGAHVETARGDILIGADGIHSRCARCCFRTRDRRAGTG